VIPGLVEISGRFDLSPAFTILVLAALLTAGVLFVQSIASWFDDRNL
jgi:import receptor subunit TOM6-like